MTDRGDAFPDGDVVRSPVDARYWRCEGCAWKNREGVRECEGCGESTKTAKLERGKLAWVFQRADDLVRQHAPGLEDIEWDNFLKLAASLGVEVEDA